LLIIIISVIIIIIIDTAWWWCQHCSLWCWSAETGSWHRHTRGATKWLPCSWQWHSASCTSWCHSSDEALDQHS